MPWHQPEMRRQHAQRTHQQALRLRWVHVPSRPTLPQCPVTDRHLNADDVPDDAAARAVEPTEGIHCFRHALACAGLALGQRIN